MQTPYWKALPAEPSLKELHQMDKQCNSGQSIGHNEWLNNFVKREKGNDRYYFVLIHSTGIKIEHIRSSGIKFNYDKCFFQDWILVTCTL